MALKKGLNSYVTLAEANSYMSDRVDVAAWEVAGDTAKERALITAATLLDLKSWNGTAVSADQSLAFPRNETFFDPKVGYLLPMSPTPLRIVQAQIEQAYHLLNNDGLLDDTGGVESINVSGIALSNIRRVREMPSLVRRLIAPLVSEDTDRSWWRNN